MLGRAGRVCECVVWVNGGRCSIMGRKVGKAFALGDVDVLDAVVGLQELRKPKQARPAYAQGHLLNTAAKCQVEAKAKAVDQHAHETVLLCALVGLPIGVSSSRILALAKSRCAHAMHTHSTSHFPTWYNSNAILFSFLPFVYCGAFYPRRSSIYILPFPLFRMGTPTLDLPTLPSARK